MLEEMDLEGISASPGATPQPSTVWSRGAHAHPGEPEHEGDDSAEDEGTSKLVYLLCFHMCSFSALAPSLAFFLSFPSFLSLMFVAFFLGLLSFLCCLPICV